MRTSRMWLTCLCAMLAVVFGSAALVAQVDTGGVTGTVKDATGAVVSGASVVLTNDATGVNAVTVSTSTGTYVFDAVRPGTYTIHCEAKGFQKFVTRGLQVHVQKTLTIDIPLVAGNISQQVTVTAAAPLLQAEDASIGQTIGTQAVNNLPLNGRNWVSLAQLSAGVSTAPIGQPTGGAGTTDSAFYSVNGVNMWQNDIRLNGINNNIEVYGGASVGSDAAITPPPDAIQEFNQQNGNFSAEFGHSTGGIVNAAIKSGTNQLHGDLWEYFRNDALNTNDYFSKQNGKSVPELRQNQFGGTIGGPVVIPHLYDGRDKTFFFFDYQGGRTVNGVTGFRTVPTALMQSSGFTNLQDLINGNGGTRTDGLQRVFPLGTVLDPATTRMVASGAVDPITGLTNDPAKNNGQAIYVRDPFYLGSLVGKTDYTGSVAQLNILPQQRMDSNAVKLLSLYPAATRSGLSNNFFYTPKQRSTTNSYDIRIDENLSPKDILFAVYDRSYITNIVPGNLPGLAVGQGGARNDSFPAYAFAVGYTRVITPTLTNEMHVGMTHAGKYQKSIYGDIFGIPAQYGIQGIPQVQYNGGLPPINIGGLSGIGVGNYTPTIQTVYSIEGSDNVTKVFRNHTFKTGIQVDSLEGDISQPPQGRGNFTFNGQFSDIPNHGSGLTGMADLLLPPTVSTVAGGIDNLGGLSSFSGSNIVTTRDHRWYTGAFFQDDWKVTPTLTLNLGLRWDYFTPYAETSGRQANFIADGGNGSTGTYYISNKGCKVPRSPGFDALLQSSGIAIKCVSGLTLGNAQNANFAPRIGFAYRITPRLVVRGGYGTAYGALGNLGYGGTLGTNYPFLYQVTFNAQTSQQPLQLSNGQTATLANAFTTINLQDPTVASGKGVNLYGRQYNFQTPYVQTINLTVQDQFTNHDSIQVGYVGTLGRHLDNLGGHNSLNKILPVGMSVQANVPYTNFPVGTTYESTDAVSSYHSMQATYEHQLDFGLTMLANYTYSKCMSDQKTQAKGTPNYRAQWLPGFGIHGDYALCDVDAAHIVHVSGSYALPVGRGKALLGNSNRVVDAVLGGWSVNYIYGYQSGQPFNLGCPIGTTSGFGCNANVVHGVDMYAGPHNASHWLNPDAFHNPPAATAVGQTDYSPLGGEGMQARGPGMSNLDSSIFKDFHVDEQMRFQFRAEAFNTFNSTELANPGSLDFTNKPNFARITGLRNGSRVLQVALKLYY